MAEAKTNKFIKGVSVQTIVTIVMGVLEVVVFSIMSRLLSRQEFGYYSALIGIISICQSIANAGLGSAIIQKKDGSPEHVSTAFTLSLIIGSTVSLLVFVFAAPLARWIADDSLTLALRIMSFVILFSAIVSVGNAQLYKRLEFKRVGIIQASSYLAASIIGIVMAVMHCGLISIVMAAVLYPVFTTVLLYTTSLKIPQLHIAKNETGGIISFGGWLTLGVIVNTVTQQWDKLVLSKWLSVEALGSYNRPAGFVSTVTGKLQNIFDVVLFPMLSDIQDNREKILSVFYRAVGLLNSFSIVLAAIFFFNAELIIQIFFGNQWLDLAIVMRIASIGVIFSIDSQLVDCFFRSLNYVRLGFFLRLFGALWMLLCIYIGTKYGIVGVAASIVFANVVFIIIKMVFLSYKVKANVGTMFYTWFKAWKPAFILCIFGALFLVFAPQTTLVRVLFAAVFGLIIIWEFAFCPSMVGVEYEKTIYPSVLKVRNELFKITKDE